MLVWNTCGLLATVVDRDENGVAVRRTLGGILDSDGAIGA